MKKIIWIFAWVLCTQTACDLQPKIVSLPDSVGDFISARYPALLADPNTQPEIYNSAASDYGVYAAPNLYGGQNTDDYVMYASVDDYIVPPQSTDSDKDISADYGRADDMDISSGDSKQTDDVLVVPEYGTPDVADDDNENVVVVERGDTLYSVAKKYNVSVSDLAQKNNLVEPYKLSVGQKLYVGETQNQSSGDVLVIKKPNTSVNTVTRVYLSEIVVAPGDTLYSLSRKYAVPVNDLAVMNKLVAPFNLAVGQKLRVPDLSQATIVDNKHDVVQVKKTAQTTDVKSAQVQNVQKNTTPEQQKIVQTKAESVKKISSDPTKKLPKITARSSSKFSWPVRGKILSQYGAKSSGLFNDGINIGAKRGTPVVAAENGVVAYAGNEVKGMGNLVIIQHSDGWMTVYAHMDAMSVRRGVRVKVGQQIGTVGKTGKVDAPQLHFEIRKGTKAYNPSNYLKK